MNTLSRTKIFQANNWLLSQSPDGVCVSSKNRSRYPEVTGYLIPSIIQWGNFFLAEQYLNWLLTQQLANGGFSAPGHSKAFIFDSGQILRGLLCFRERNEVQAAIRKVFSYLKKQSEQGSFRQQYKGEISENVLIYVLPPLIEAAAFLDERDDWILNLRDGFLNRADFAARNQLTHFLGYQLEAAIDLQVHDRVLKTLKQIANQQMNSGFLESHPGSIWQCIPGSFQIAICFSKLGDRETSLRIGSEAESHQNHSGGFLGSIGRGSTYFGNEEIPWALKYYLDWKFLNRD